MLNKPIVHILLATYNGENFLAQQLESIANQNYHYWTLTVSDDGSSDNTLAIVERFAKQVSQRVTILQGPNQGSSTANFFHLIEKAPATNTDDLYAYCDQDDVWCADKLQQAVTWHLKNSDQAVRLYCGRTQFTNAQLKRIGLSTKINRPPSFGNALVQNIASGNTMVFSVSVLTAQKKILPEHSVWHDWTTYIVATAMGGVVYFDDEPRLLYRQHEANVIGSNDDLRAQIKRLKPLFSGRYKRWLDLNEQAINDISNELTQHSLEIFSDFKKMRRENTLANRLKIYKNSKIRRQKISSNALLTLALVLKIF